MTKLLRFMYLLVGVTTLIFCAALIANCISNNDLNMYIYVTSIIIDFLALMYIFIDIFLGEDVNSKK